MMQKKILILLLSWSAIICGAATYTPSTVPDPKQWGADSYVSNPDSILAPEVVADLNKLCRMLEDSTDVELAIVAIGDKGDYDMFDFGFELFQRWGIGKEGKNTGALITLSHDTHDIFINTGTGIEGVLTDALCSQIINETMIPLFRENDYDGGILMGAMRIYEICTDGNAPEELLNMQSVTNRGGYTSSKSDTDFGWSFWLVTIIVTFAFLLPFLGMILYQGKKQTTEKEIAQRRGCKFGMVVLCIFWPFAIPALIWFIIRSRRYRCPHCGKRQFVRAECTTIEAATYTAPGKELITYRCKKCGYEEKVESTIPKLAPVTTSSSSSSWDSSSSSWGSSSSGSWGGGSSSGGGAGGHW